MTDVLGTWSEFNVAMLGATAALAGLVIVAASVNVEKIIASPVLVARLAAALATLLLTLIVSGFGLFPELEPFWYGVAVLCVSLPVLVIQGYASYRVQVDPERHGRQRILKSIPGVHLPRVLRRIGRDAARGASCRLGVHRHRCAHGHRRRHSHLVDRADRGAALSRASTDAAHLAPGQRIPAIRSAMSTSLTR